MVKLPALLLIAAAMTAATAAAGANAARHAAFDSCRLYGFAPRSAAYAQCRMNLRHFWTTGPCGNRSFAAMHREYCHLNLPPFL